MKSIEGCNFDLIGIIKILYVILKALDKVLFFNII